MAFCEYRITPDQARDQTRRNIREGRGMIVFAGPNVPMCQIAMDNPEEFYGFLACGYPDESTETCPIAREEKALSTIMQRLIDLQK